MPDISLNPLATSLHGTLERVQAETRESEERTHAVRALISAAHNIGDSGLLAALQAEAAHLDALTHVIADAVQALDLAQAEVASLHTGAQRLTNAVGVLGDAEQEVLAHAANVEADLGGVDAHAAGWADTLQQALAHEFDPLTNTAEAAAQQVAAAATATAAAADVVADSLAEWTQTFERDAHSILGEGWEGLADNLGARLVAADGASAADMDRSGGTIEAHLLGMAGTTAAKVTNSTEQVSDVLHQVNDKIGTAKALRDALQAASGML